MQPHKLEEPRSLAFRGPACFWNRGGDGWWTIPCPHLLPTPVPAHLDHRSPRLSLLLPQHSVLDRLDRQSLPVGGRSNPRSHLVCIFPGSSDGKVSACNAGDLGSIPESGRSPGEGNDNPLQYSCLENPMDRGAWRATVHRITKNRTRLQWLGRPARKDSGPQALLCERLAWEMR